MCGCCQLNPCVIQAALGKHSNLHHPPGAAWRRGAASFLCFHGQLRAVTAGQENTVHLPFFTRVSPLPICDFPIPPELAEPWCLCLILKTFRVPNGFQSSVSRLTLTGWHRLGSNSPRAAVVLWQDKWAELSGWAVGWCCSHGLQWMVVCLICFLLVQDI